MHALVEKYEDQAQLEFHANVYKKIFESVNSVKFSMPLTPNILSDPKHEFVRTLFFVFSM